MRQGFTLVTITHRPGSAQPEVVSEAIEADSAPEAVAAHMLNYVDEVDMVQVFAMPAEPENPADVMNRAGQFLAAAQSAMMGGPTG